jgi:transcriptional regulator GlxA family with amidase domain
MLLARAGLLRNRPAITHHSAIGDLRAADARVIEERVVDDGDIVTCGGVTAGIDLALWLVERFLGADKASETAAHIEYERRGGVWLRPE